MKDTASKMRRSGSVKYMGEDYIKDPEIQEYPHRSDESWELYLYSLRKMAEGNMENNRTFMTNLYNLGAFQYKAAEVMLENPKDQFAVIVVDIANFKAVNDFCGRDAGDELLRAIAEEMRKIEGDKVVLSHFRADIFGLLMPFHEKEELVQVTKNIANAITAVKINCKVLPAFGICIATSPYMSVSLMRDYAAMALNTIKGKFYASYAFFDEHMRSHMLLEKQIENGIVEALETGQFRLYIQPKVDIDTGKIVGGEALVRWLHPQKGIIGPNEFIPVLEKNGFIINVDTYVWEEVFRFLHNQLEQGKKIVPISINISRLHAFNRNFIKCLSNLRDKYQIPASFVPLELTESGYLETESIMYQNMQLLKTEGFTLSMDDFGTGYSTMTMLKDHDVDEVKIDRSFVVDMSERSRIIVEHTISMLQELGKDIVAEGIETREQMEFVRKCGCKKVQGFLYYKPMPADEFAELLKKV